MLSENGTVITVTEPQVWVLIAVFSAAIFGMIGVVTASFNRTLTSEISGLRDTMNAKFEAMDAKFEALTVRLEAMDRDIQALTRHIFGGESR